MAGTPEPPPKEKTLEEWGQGGGKKLEGKLRPRFRILVGGSARFLDHIALDGMEIVFKDRGRDP